MLFKNEILELFI